MPFRPSLAIGLLLGLVATALLVAGMAVMTDVGGPDAAASNGATLGGSLLGFGILVAIGALVVGLRGPERAHDADDPTGLE